MVEVLQGLFQTRERTMPLGGFGTFSETLSFASYGRVMKNLKRNESLLEASVSHLAVGQILKPNVDHCWIHSSFYHTGGFFSSLQWF